VNVPSSGQCSISPKVSGSDGAARIQPAAGERDGGCGNATGAAVERDVPAEAVAQPARDGQPQAAALAVRCSAEMSLEGAGEHRVVHAGTVVAYRQPVVAETHLHARTAVHDGVVHEVARDH